MDISQFRQQVDAALNTTRMLPTSRELASAITNLQLAFSWMGITAKAGGLPSPYKEGYNAESTQIEPVKDRDENRLLLGFTAMEDNLVKKVKFIRADIVNTVKMWEDYVSISLGEVVASGGKEAGDKYLAAAHQVVIGLTNAEIWLEWELNRLGKTVTQVA